jgi:hypothetical protein
MLPKNDPDFFDQQESILYWWLELDETGMATREIGFAVGAHAIRCAPAARNRGAFIGERVSPGRLEEEISKGAFEASWRRALETLPIHWPHGDSR